MLRRKSVRKRREREIVRSRKKKMPWVPENIVIGMYSLVAGDRNQIQLWLFKITSSEDSSTLRTFPCFFLMITLYRLDSFCGCTHLFDTLADWWGEREWVGEQFANLCTSRLIIILQSFFNRIEIRQLMKWDTEKLYNNSRNNVKWRLFPENRKLLWAENVHKDSQAR